MDLWVVAAAAGAGYLAKYLSGESELSSGNSTPRQSDFRDLLQQIRDQTSPFRRWLRRRLEKESSERGDDISDEQLNDASTSGSGATMLANVGNYENYNVLTMTSLLPEFQGKQSCQEGSVGEGFDNCGDVLPKSDTNRLSRRRPLRSRWSHEFYAKPLNSLESCLTAQLYRDQERGEDYLIRSGPPSLTQTVRPLLVTDGNRRMIREGIDSLGVRDGGKERRVKNKVGISLEDTSSTSLGTHSPQQIGIVELVRKPEQRIGKGQLSSSTTRLSVGTFPSQGSPEGMLLFIIGITIGIISTIISNKKEMDDLSEMLKQSENLVRDLQEELEMKAMLTVKEIAGEYHQSQVTTDCSSSNPEPIASSSKQKSAKHERKELDDQEVESHELMSKIEAELEAELERLELNMKASTLESISDFVELNPDFEAEVIQGDLKVGLVQSRSDSDASWTPADHTQTANYAVSPRELSLRLHEVIKSRLEARIEELEAALQNSQKKVQSLKWQHRISQTNMASSTPGSPNVNEVYEMDQPFEINLSGEGLDARSEAYDEIIWVADSNQETPDAACRNSHIEEVIPRYHKRLGEGQNKGRDNLIGTLEERILRSRGSSEVAAESEDGESDDELLIRQIVKKSRQGLSTVLNSS
ncbi:uncharacterized protein LOC131310559 [Rhododendron vialii]|uniref:uncharacterized protein LOC131310559 n=1 Tax=Rhododendron vialii TaxID=182163 RepID=UPI00265E4C75|nr:uncharacterized protein LOC131310559 [Rhododendron vialii]XP_058193624.1 uncharacterized protein LOC131310559 [Rhododendron vialii]